MKLMCMRGQGNNFCLWSIIYLVIIDTYLWLGLCIICYHYTWLLNWVEGLWAVSRYDIVHNERRRRAAEKKTASTARYLIKLPSIDSQRHSMHRY
jgi:hypothetical protein